MCRSGCKTQDHKSWGACARAARVTVWGPERQTHVAADAEVALYDRAWADGLDPEGIYPEHVEKAYREADAAGEAPAREE